MYNQKLNSIVLLSLVIMFSACQQQESESVQEEIAATNFIKTNGADIIDLDGNPIILKGTNLGNWLVPEGYMFKMGQVNAPRKIDELLYELIGPDSLTLFWEKYLDNYITHDDIKYLKQIGSNHIRLPFHYKLLTPDLYMGQRNSGFEYFDRIMEWCRQENLYVLFDMHCAPGGQTGDNIDDSYGYPYLLESQSSQDLASEVWVKIAERYKNDPIVLGYDIVNEPVAHYFKDVMEDYNHKLYTFYQRVIKDIREVDPNHTIFLNGSIWSTDFDVFEESMGDNIVYEFHKYWFEVNQSAVQDYVDFRDEHQVPIYIGETGENTDEWVNDFRVLLDVNHIGWCFWPYKKMDNTRGIMNFDQPEHYPLITEYAASDRSTYKNARENRPDKAKVQQALNEFLENSLYRNNYQNPGYIEALGLEVQE